MSSPIRHSSTTSICELPNEFDEDYCSSPDGFCNFVCDIQGVVGCRGFGKEQRCQSKNRDWLHRFFSLCRIWQPNSCFITPNRIKKKTYLKKWIVLFRCNAWVVIALYRNSSHLFCRRVILYSIMLLIFIHACSLYHELSFRSDGYFLVR